MNRKKIIIMGAAGRDFHNFNVCFRNAPEAEVTAFTATQIPNIEGRIYPPVLAGPHYPKGIPIYPESELPELLKNGMAEEVIFAYSDVSHETVMHKASLVLSLGANFRLLGPGQTQIRSKIPVVSIGAVRTGAGKSQTTRKVAGILKQLGARVVVIRHPMPYGDLSRQVCERFETEADLDRYHCTLEEREEYSPHLERGVVVYAGVDYEAILKQAEQEADILVWDGGNNDFPFYKSDLHIVVADPHRPGHELKYHPGETNLRMADCIIINKIDSASPENINIVKSNIKQLNPQAMLIEAASLITADQPKLLQEKKVLAIEDGPTVTHGEMGFGAAYWFAKQHHGILVDPKPYAVGSIRKVFENYPHLKEVLPAMGYSKEQIQELRETIATCPCDVVAIGTPADLRKIMDFPKPSVRITYELDEQAGSRLHDILKNFFCTDTLQKGKNKLLCNHTVNRTVVGNDSDQGQRG